MGRVEGKVAIVTGGASNPGIGHSTAELLAQEGASVVVTDLDLVGAELCVKAILDKGGRAVALRHEVGNEDSWKSVVQQVESIYGRIDTLVNNAGIFVQTTSLEELELADWNRQVEVNLTSVFLGCKHVIPVMRKMRGGSIINLSSVAGLVGAGTGAYGATKAGVRILSKSVGVYYAAENIRCNSVHPGLIHTNMNQLFFDKLPEKARHILAGVPMGRKGEPKDIANMILFLASDESQYVTGAEFVVDGGQSAH
jgi:NAD(P)-dependent dehydrogenase (short-subunit alcohol dehydrogenase family)